METKQTYSTRLILSRLFRLMRHLLPFIGLAVFFALLGFVTTAAIPSLLIQLGFTVLAGQPLTVWPLLFLISLAFARGLFRYGEHYFGHFVAFHSLADLRKLTFAKLRRLAPAKLDRQDSGRLLKIIAEDIEALEVFFAHTIAPVCTGILSALLMALGLAVLSPWLALTALLAYLLLAAVLPRYFARQLQAGMEEQHRVRSAYLSFFLESLKAMGDLAQLGKTQARFARLTEQSQAVNRLELQTAQKQFLQQAWSFLVLGLSLTVFALLALLQAERGELEVQTAVLALAAFSSSFAPFLELGRLPLGFKRAMNAGRNVFALLDEAEPELTGSEQAVLLDDVLIENLTFAYEGRERSVFTDLSARFDKGKIIGLLGASGSGKSTLMKLIMRWYDAQTGHISFSGKDSRDSSRQHLQAFFAYVPQTAQLFHQSLRENLLLGRTDISDADIWELAERCRLKERLEKLPQGLDTVIDGEADFSAGECQRLELVRALLKDADCYIFDEPTSNLDSLNEAAFLAIVKEECRGMVFLISHRPSTVALADEIYELEASHIKRIK
ncbi:putative ABC transporter ATP-binding protein [Streptococcus sp. DD11]|uniref:amino acid ABC transporter ATP-binding/permease protein n=1 Tax=Streptococcus sp. DD11 TaxID=1777879 RepID=UPI000797D534|nr:ABC transporter ATP-binding protein [Streptococcus sp. DD11]KXT84808.1 putative ABC transporter ATP-binding protein [Streptococcus sp. DD11]